MAHCENVPRDGSYIEEVVLVVVTVDQVVLVVVTVVLGVLVAVT